MAGRFYEPSNALDVTIPERGPPASVLTLSFGLLDALTLPLTEQRALELGYSPEHVQ